MPELPEVEVVRKGLEALVVGKKIKQVDVLWENLVVKDESLEQWVKSLEQETIHHVERRGKYLIFVLDAWVLVSHLRMEGKYFYEEGSDKSWTHDPHTHVIFHFDDGSRLLYHDVRKFGRFERLGKDELQAFFAKKKLGPEPTREAFSLTSFMEALKKSKRNIKAHLLSQEVVAGLGNIYADEVLFQAGIYPLSRSCDLKEEQIANLHEAIIRTLEEAQQAGGTTIRTYHNTFGEKGTYQESLLVYGKAGSACPQCGHPLEKIKVAQRGTTYCPICQKAGKQDD